MIVILLGQDKEIEIREAVPRQNLMNLYNAFVEQVAEGYIAIGIPQQKALIRDSGIFYGGVLAALADTAAYFAAATLHSSDAYFLTVELKINYLNPAKGEKLIAQAEVIKNGKTLIICKTDIYAITGADKMLVATSLVTLMSKPKKINLVNSAKLCLST